MRITEILGRIWLFPANKLKSLNLLVNNQLVELKSSLWQKLGTIVR